MISDGIEIKDRNRYPEYSLKVKTNTIPQNYFRWCQDKGSRLPIDTFGLTLSKGV